MTSKSDGTAENNKPETNKTIHSFMDVVGYRLILILLCYQS